MASEKPARGGSRGGAGAFLADDHRGPFRDIAADDFSDTAIGQANAQLYGARRRLTFLHPNGTGLTSGGIAAKCREARALIWCQHRIQPRNQALACGLRLLAPCIRVLRECRHTGAHFRTRGFNFRDLMIFVL
jgi:hypothetical protein